MEAKNPKTPKARKPVAKKAAATKEPQAPKVDGRLKSVATADWEGITRAWRAGVLSGRAIADLYEVPESTLREKMGEWGIERDLAPEVRKEVRAQILRTESGVDNPTSDEIVQEAANAQVAIIRTHQKRLNRLSTLVETLATELEFDSNHVEQLQDDIYAETNGDKDGKRRARMLAAVSLGGRASVLQALANSVTKFITLERQAHGIETNPGEKKPGLDDILELVDGTTAGLPFVAE